MNQPLFNKLTALKKSDLDTRFRLLSEGRLYGDYAPEMQQVQKENANQLDRIVEEFGWPGISLVGLEACRAAWLIAQHSICTPELQRKFLTLLSNACKHANAPKMQVAFLTDRIRFNENKPQMYGTILDWDENGELNCEVEDPANLDLRRREVGLPPFNEDLDKHRAEVKAEGGNPPADFTAYKQKARAWAIEVGWI